MLLCVKRKGDFMGYFSQDLAQTKWNNVTNSVIPITMTTITNRFGNITAGYNNQYRTLLGALNTKKAELSQIVQDNLLQNPNYTGSRNAGVKLAWQYEKADIEMGGKGSANWTSEEKNQILNSKTGTVNGAEGHHQKNVVDHPVHQADPDNIKFYKSRQEHLQEGHDGNFQNETDAPFINKNKMLKYTNSKRVLLNEIRGVSISAAIGFGVSLTISAIAEMASVGIDTVEVNELMLHSLKTGIEGGITSSVIYCSGRIVSQLLQKCGVDILSKMGSFINYAAIGSVSIGLVSTIQFVKMKIKGSETIEAFREVGKSALFSASILAVSIIVQGMYGGYAGLIVSTSIGLVMLTINVANSFHQNKISNNIKEYAIEEYRRQIIIE